MSKGKQHHSIHANPASGLRKGRKAIHGLSAAIIASAMMGGGAVAQTVWDSSFTTGSWDYGSPSSVTLRNGATVSASNPGTTYIGATSFQLESGTINQVNLTNGFGGVGTLTKSTDGTAIILGVQSYSGGTIVNDGTLQLGQGGTNGALNGQLAGGITVNGPGNLEVRYADGTSFGNTVTLNGATSRFTSWVAPDSVNYIDGTIAGGGDFDVRGGGTSQIRGGVAITGDVDVREGRLVVEGAVTASDIQTGLHGVSNTQVRVDGGSIGANVHLRLGADLEIEDGGVVVGNVSWSGNDTDTASTNISISDASRLEGNVVINNGNVSLLNGISDADRNLLIGGVTILNEGNVTAANFGSIIGNVWVNTGDVTLTGNSSIAGDISVQDGDISLAGGYVVGNINVTLGDVTLTSVSGITGAVDLTDGDLTLSGASVIAGKVDLANGILSLSGASRVVGPSVDIINGYATITGGSTVETNLSVDNAGPGGVAVTVTDSGVWGAVTVRIGDVRVTRGHIQNDVNITEAGNLLVTGVGQGVEGNVILANGNVDVTSSGNIDGNVAVNDNNVTVNNGTIGGNVTVRDGTIDVDNGGFIGGNANVRDGVIIVNNGGEIDLNASVRDGSIILDNGGYIGGNASVRDGVIALDNDSEIDGTASVRNGSISLDNDSAIFDDISITVGNVTLNNGSYAGDEIFIGTGSLFVNDGSEVDGDVYVTTGNVNVTAGSDIDADVSVTTGNVNLNDGDIDGDVIIVTGHLEAYNNSDVSGDVTISTGNATLNDSDIDGRLTITNGNVSLDDSTVGTVADDGIHVGTGNVTLANGSLVIGDSSIQNGNLTLTGDSNIGGNIQVLSGNFSATQQSDVLGNVLIGDGTLSLDLDSNIQGNVTVNGDASLNRDSDILGNLRSLSGDVFLDNDSSVSGTVNVDNGDLVLDHTSSIGGLATVESGDILLDNNSILENGAYVQDGDIVLQHGSSINRNAIGGEDVTVEHGSITLLTGSTINNSTISVLAGQVTAVENSVITGNVSVTESRVGDAYAVGLDNADINGNVFVGRGNIVLDDTAEINGDVTVLEGDITLNFASEINAAVLGDNVFVALGNVSLDNYSEINSSVSVSRGDVSLNRGSEINGNVDILDEGNLLVANNSDVVGNVNVNKGTVVVFHESGILGDVNVTGTDLHPGAVVVNEESAIIGSVTVGVGDILVDNFSAIDGALITTDLGDIDVLNGSSLTGHVIINEGHLELDSTSVINGLVDVNAEAAAHFGGIVNGNVNLNGGGAGIFDGGVLYGNPTITGDLSNSGLLTPGYRSGNPIGTVNVGGDYFQSSAGTYLADIGANKSHDRVLVDGEAFLGGNLVVRSDAKYKPYRNDRFRLLHAEGGRTGQFDNVIHGYGNTMLDFKVRYSSQSVWATIVQRKFAKLSGLTHNQKQVAKALDHAAVRNQIDKAFDHLNYTHVSNVPALLQLLSPEQLTSIFTISSASAQLQNVNIERRLDAVRDGRVGAFSSEGFSLRNDRGTINIDGPIANTADGLTIAGWDGKSIVSTKEVIQPIVHQSRWNVYITGHGDWGTIKNTSQALGQEFTTAGVSVGADLLVSENFVVGLTGGYTNTQSDIAHGGDIKVNSGRGSVYASVFGSGAYLNAAVGGGFNSYTTKRATIGGFANGDSDGGEFNALLGLGYDFRFGGFSIGPVASAQYTYTGLSSFTETGSAAPQHFDSQSNDSFRTLVGLKMDYAINAGNVVIRPEVRAQWKHEYLDTAPSITARFDGASSNFTVNGPDIGRDSLVLDAGAAVEFNNTWSVFAYYTGELGRKNYDSHSVNGGVRVSF